MKKRWISVFLTGIIAMSGICGCGDKSSIETINSEERMAEGEATDEADITPVTDRENDSVNAIGSTITWSNFYEESLQYTLNKVEISENLSDLGIKKNELTQQYVSSITEEGTLIDNNYIFIAIDVTVKNMNYPGVSNTDGEQYRVYIETLLETEAELQNEDGIRHNGEAAYFSEHGETEQQYYAFTLEPEQEIDAKLVWIVPKEDLEEPIYYIIGAATGRDTYQYFLLNEGN